MLIALHSDDESCAGYGVGMRFHLFYFLWVVCFICYDSFNELPLSSPLLSFVLVSLPIYSLSSITPKLSRLQPRCFET